MTSPMIGPPTLLQEKIQTREPVTIIQVTNNLDLLRIVVNQTSPLDNSDRGLCPFCSSRDETAFNIYKKSRTDRARFHCFVCGARGDVFNFLQRTEKLTFTQAKTKLSEMISRLITSVGGSEDSQSQFQGLLDSCEKYCEKDCIKYTALLEDYNSILEQTYSDSGIQIHPDLTTVPNLVSEILSLREQIEILEKKLKQKHHPTLGGFGSPTIRPKPEGQLL